MRGLRRHRIGFAVLCFCLLLAQWVVASPVADPQTLDLLEDFRKKIVLTGTPAGLPAYIATIPDSTTQGVLYQSINGVRGNIISAPHTLVTSSSNEVIYKPAKNLFGTAACTFDFYVVDNGTSSANATITIDIESLNDAPIAESAEFNMESHPTDVQTLVLALNGSDVDTGDVIRFLVQPPTQGALYQYDQFDPDFHGDPILVTEYVTDPDGRVSFSPGIGEVGRPYAEITFEVEDGQLNSDPAGVVTVNVLLNEKPVALPSNATTDEDVGVLIYLNATTETGNPSEQILDLIQAIITTLPKKGQLFSVNATGHPTTQIQTTPGLVGSDGRAVYYVPDQDENGGGTGDFMDSFDFIVNNGRQDSDNSAKVHVFVDPVNDAPVAIDVNAISLSNNEMIVRLDGTDIDGDSIEAYIVDPPVKGSLRQLDANGDPILAGDKVNNALLRVIYTPDPKDKYSETFTYRVKDASLFSDNVATVSVSVGGINLRPVVYNDSLTTDEDVGLLITLNGTDLDSDDWTAVITSVPQYGLLYQVDTFGTQTDPIPVEDLAVVDDQHRVLYVPTCNPITHPATCIPNPDTGLPTGQDGNGLPLYDTFSFKAQDGNGDDSLDFAYIHIGVNPLNDAPVVLDQTFSVNEDEALVINLPYVDVDSDLANITAYITQKPDVGELFQFRNVSGSVIGENITDATLPILVNDTELRVVYVPPADQYGAAIDDFVFATLKFYVTDESVSSVRNATERIRVLPVADPPVVYNSSVTMLEDTKVIVYLQGDDVDQDTWKAIIKTVPSKGELYQVTETGGQGAWIPAPNLQVTDQTQHRVMYVPHANLFGPTHDWFEFEARDSSNLPSDNVARVLVNVTAVNDAPEAVATDVFTDEDVGIAFSLNLLDVENDNLTVRVVSFPHYGEIFQWNGTHPTTQITINGTVVTHPGSLIYYEPPLNQHGESNVDNYAFTQFMFSAFDGQDNSTSPGVVTIHVDPVNDVPVATDAHWYGQEDTPLLIDFSQNVSDPDVVSGDTLRASIVALPGQGTLRQYDGSNVPGDKILNPIELPAAYPTLVWYEPPTDLSGAAFTTFQYQVRDSAAPPAVSSTETITIHLDPVNDAPVAEDGSYEIGTNNEQFTNVTLTATDVDGDTLQYMLSRLPAKGRIYRTATLVGTEYILSDELLLGDVTNQTYWYFSPNDEGSSFPYVTFDFTALDNAYPDAKNHTATIDFTVVCQPGKVNNIWDDTGYVCAPCPTGASCSSEGAFPPVSKNGYWRSQTDAGKLLGFVACQPAEACVGDWDGSNSSQTLASTNNQSDPQCSEGYVGRLCGDCAENYYRLDNQCKACPESQLGQLILIGVPVSVFVLWVMVIVARRGADLAFLAISLNFVQFLAVLSDYQLAWPRMVTTFFTSASISHLNLDLFSLECDFPGLTYSTKWKIVMVTPAVAAAVFLLFFLVYAVYLSCGYRCCGFGKGGSGPSRREWLDAERRRNQNNNLDAKNGGGDAKDALFSVNAGVEEDDSQDDGWLEGNSDGEAGEDSLEVQASGDARQSRRHISFKVDLQWGVGMLVRAWTIFLLVAYFPLLIKAFQILDCTEMDDGTTSLDAQPDLNCDDDWWSDLFPWAVFCVFLYGLGIPIYFLIVLFAARPPMRNGRKICCFYCPPRAEGESFLSSLAVKDKRRTGVMESDIYDDEHVGHLQSWQFKYQSLSIQYSPHFFFWSLVVTLRKFLLAATSVLMTEEPMYQGTLALMILFFSLLLQLRYKPFRWGTGMNRLEFLQITVCCICLFLGFLFYGEPDADQVVTDTLTALLFILVFSVFLFMALMLIQQLLEACNRSLFNFLASDKHKRKQKLAEEARRRAQRKAKREAGELSDDDEDIDEALGLTDKSRSSVVRRSQQTTHFELSGQSRTYNNGRYGSPRSGHVVSYDSKER